MQVHCPSAVEQSQQPTPMLVKLASITSLFNWNVLRFHTGFFLFLRRFCTIIKIVSSKVMDLIGCKVTIMQNRNTNLNDIYMSDRLQAQLQQIDPMLSEDMTVNLKYL